MGQQPCCAQRQGLPSALSNIRTACTPPEGHSPALLTTAGPQGDQGWRGQQPPAREGLAAAGSCREAGAWQSRQGLSTAVCCQAWARSAPCEHRLCPDSFLASPPGQDQEQLEQRVPAPAHAIGEDRQCRGGSGKGLTKPSSLMWT